MSQSSESKGKAGEDGVLHSQPAPPDGHWGWVVALGAALVQMQVESSMGEVPATYHLSLPLQLSLSEA